MHLRTAVNLPLSSTFAVRFAGDFIKQDGYVVATEVPGDYHLNDTHNYHVRVTALWQPVENFSIVSSLEYAKVVQHEPESKNILDPNPNPWDETSDWPGVYDIDQTHRHHHRDPGSFGDDLQIVVERSIHEPGRLEFGERPHHSAGDRAVWRRERPVRAAPELRGDAGIRRELQARRPARLGGGRLLSR